MISEEDIRKAVRIIGESLAELDTVSGIARPGMVKLIEGRLNESPEMTPRSTMWSSAWRSRCRRIAAGRFVQCLVLCSIYCNWHATLLSHARTPQPTRSTQWKITCGTQRVFVVVFTEDLSAMHALADLYVSYTATAASRDLRVAYARGIDKKEGRKASSRRGIWTRVISSRDGERHDQGRNQAQRDHGKPPT